jgi:hypothetical protein
MGHRLADVKGNMHRSSDYVEVCCPSHDNPACMLIPKMDRSFS